METMDHAVRVLHIGDVFLDCPFSSMRARESAARRREARETFLRAVRFAREREADLVLITGNLIDNHYATFETQEFLLRAFAEAPKCRFVITPGTHDPIGEYSIFRLGSFPGNVHIFTEEAPGEVTYPDIGVRVVGWAYRDASYPGSPLAGIGEAGEPAFATVIAGYATEDAEDGTASVTVNEIGESGCDYLALSGGSLFDGFRRAGKTTYAYSGALEHSCYEEPGFGGGNFVTLTPKGDGVLVTGERVDFGSRRFVMEEFDMTGIDSQNELLNRITTVIKDRGYGRETALKVILTGKVPVGFTVPVTMTSDNFGVYLFEIEDRTEPAFDDSQVARDMTVRGELLRTLIPGTRTGTEEERQAAAYALKLGIAALEGKDLSKY